jgi:hypothetical protein
MKYIYSATATIALIFGVVFAQGVAQSTRPQQSSSSTQVYYPSMPSYSPGYGGVGWGFPGQAGTAASSYMYGLSSVIQAAGSANLMNSAAANNWEAAYSADLDNRMKATNTYFEMRRVNRQSREEERGPRPTSEELARYARDAAPKRLTPRQLDPVSGEVAWPGILQEQQYSKSRETIDRMFAEREASGGGVGASGYRQLHDAIEQMRTQLISNIKNYHPQNYMDARRFLDSLDYESRFVTG